MQEKQLGTCKKQIYISKTVTPFIIKSTTNV